ncbi:MAG: N-acetyl-gamma-glutamyl-phosphate reductase [Actinobacteria bacterium]|nr:N-acetyl-gamma-glutamyl-phosphate reductase [Actinomycetota bacterium]
MKCAVIGASGYTGGELLRLISRHDQFEATEIVAHTNAGELIGDIHPGLTDYGAQRFKKLDIHSIRECEIVFMALPHGQSSQIVSQLPEGQMIIDLGADFRLESSYSWEKYYGGDHPGTWVYGLPELPGQRAKVASSLRVANPGCYATAIELSLAPLLKVIESEDIVVVAASGTTGAGRSAKHSLSASTVMNSLTSYKFGGIHQHTPEIEESLTRIGSKPVKVSFTPILAPMPRGILSTITARLSSEISEISIRELFEEAYSHEQFIHLLPIGQMPQSASVNGSNNVQIQVGVDSHTNRVIVSTVIDNLGKGAAGQAIQNANIMNKLPEGMSLLSQGLGV